jgi:hypothetical protein
MQYPTMPLYCSPPTGWPSEILRRWPDDLGDLHLSRRRPVDLIFRDLLEVLRGPDHVLRIRRKQGVRLARCARGTGRRAVRPHPCVASSRDQEASPRARGSRRASRAEVRSVPFTIPAQCEQSYVLMRACRSAAPTAHTGLRFRPHGRTAGSESYPPRRERTRSTHRCPALTTSGTTRSPTSRFTRTRPYPDFALLSEIARLRNAEKAHTGFEPVPPP